MSLQPAKSRDDFTAAIICALPLEADMVKRVFDLKYKDRGKDFGKAKGDRNKYTTGVIGIHNVVLIHMAAMGKINAAVAATEARMSFRHIQIALVVGICGVLPKHPETKEDIILGDCIISRTIVQYDFGRRYSNTFTAKPTLQGLHNPYIPSLLAMLQTHDDRHALTEELMKYLEEMNEKFEVEDLYPGPNRDKLYKSGYRHAHTTGSNRCLRCIPGTEMCLADCEAMGCSVEQLVQRERLLSANGHLGSPRIHFGNMGSGDSVIKSSSERDRIAHEYSLVAFEMEGAGVWNSFPTVVIKSACDYADSHKNKGWQHFAAAVAAAGLKAFLQNWTSTEKAMSETESARWSMMSSNTIDDAASIVSYTPSRNFEMDPTIMMHRRYQQAYPSLYRGMANDDWRSSIGSEDNSSIITTTTLNPHVLVQLAPPPIKIDEQIFGKNDLSPDGPLGSSSKIVSPRNLQLSVDVGPQFVLSMDNLDLHTNLSRDKNELKGTALITMQPEDSLSMTAVPIKDTTDSMSDGKALKDEASSPKLGTSTALDDEIVEILSDIDTLISEMNESLIKHARVPSTTESPSKKDILYPAYVCSLTLSEMWNNGFVKESEDFMANFMVNVQDRVLKSMYPVGDCAFWLTNVHEVLSFVFLAEDWYDAQKDSSKEYERLLAIIKHDLESLEFNIYHTLLLYLKRRLEDMIIPSIVESQSLPGFVTAAVPAPSGNRRVQRKSADYNMDSLLGVLNNTWNMMKRCYLEEDTIRQVKTELMKHIGIIAFNDLLSRKGFLTWQRGLQINYNLTRIEEWAKSHELPEVTLQIEHAVQATKLIQLRKSTLQDLATIADICWMLTPHQQSTLLSNYIRSAHEGPIDKAVSEAITAKVDTSQPLLLPAPDIRDSGPYEIPDPRMIQALETYTPDWLHAPKLKRLVEIVSTQALESEEARTKTKLDTIPEE